ncbi:protein FAM71B [Drosophila novamexicana]|uniref:protein FAM71B n=1 Tax=Drosophila novamexicana TaxID=47314 RepID=UPI0011E5FFED|nr:protein FAM71B [Drosophila novamexicana]
MKHPVASLLLLSSLMCLTVLAEKPSHMLKARRGSYFNEPALARSNDASVAVALDTNADKDKLSEAAAGVGGASSSGSSGSISATGNKDASSGRLFLKKFLMFKNMFSSNNQPVIPIIITGAGTGSATTPTTTVTSTGSIPTATGTVTTSPTSPTSPTTPTTATGREYYGQQEDEQQEGDEAAEEEPKPAGAIAMAANAELIDEQALQAALAAGAQEYEVFTEGDQADTGATESKASQNNRINLRRKGARRGQGQMISVRIPPRYRRYFKNGQKVMLNTKSRPNKRRVVRRRVQNKNKRFNNRRRGGKNKNKKGKGKNKNKRPRLPVV